MANWMARTSSDAAGSLGCEYDVFLNFRGEDTRHNFTDFLYNHLENAGVHTFRDEEKLSVGDVISDRLERAINNSTIYIPVFSQTYATSKWCLRELKLMVDNVSKSEGQKSILPIFLLVKPDDIKLKTPLDSNASYKASFLEHEKKFPDEVEAWKTALGKVDEHKGWVVEKNTSQAKIVESVVENVLEKLKTKQKLVPKDLVGLDGRVKHLTELLDINDCDVRLIAIYGMGGIGKTTIAKVVFNHLYFHFGKRCSFLEHIRESSSTKEGTDELQKKLLSDIVGSKSVEQFEDSEHRMQRIGDTLSTKKVLVVLDDVDDKEHINKLIGKSSLHLGSRIIITARNIAILHDEGFKGKIQRYEMLKMEDGLALQLFCQHAFNRHLPPDDYRKLSREIVSSTGGLPLAIEVIGSLLKRRDEAFWKETLVSLMDVPEQKILKKLKISYDGLDKSQKQIFLDIACFFFNKEKTDAIYMWASCQFNPLRGIDVLTARCLIKILDNGKLWMHDQLIALGRKIVREDNLGDLGKQSRLWIPKEASQIITTKKWKARVQALEIGGPDDHIEITNEDLERLPNLRFLDLYHGTYAGDFARCRSNLRWFSWHSPRYFRADKLYLDCLVVCKFYWIDFEDDSQAWDLIKRAENLKVLSITWGFGITTIPDISKCSGLERLTLVECHRLKRVESFIGNLQSLIEFKIENCENFTDLPKEVGALVKLKHFSLAGCSRLRELPSSLKNLTSLIELDLSGTIIRELPNFIGNFKKLCILCIEIDPYIDREDHDWLFPSGITTLVNLEELKLSSRDMRGEIPIGIGELSSLRILNLEYTSICGIPRTINMLHDLQELHLWDCVDIQELPELPTSLTHLSLRSISLFSIPDLSNLTNLVFLWLSVYSSSTHKSNLITGCNIRWIGGLSRLERLRLNLLNVSAPPELASLSHLEELNLYCLDLKPLVQLPSSYWRLRNLSTLLIYWCEVEDIPLDALPLLEDLNVFYCKPLQRLSIPLESTKLRQADVLGCPELVEIEVMGPLKSLGKLTIRHCKSLTKIGGLLYLKNLEILEVKRCDVLIDVEGLNELESLKHLEVRECTSLRRLIDATCTSIPDDCFVYIEECGDFIKDSISVHGSSMSLKRYKEVVLPNTPNQMERPFTIIFHLGVERSCEGFGFVGGPTFREDVTPESVTYNSLIDDMKGLSLKSMWYNTASEYPPLLIEIKSDEQVKGMVQLASERGFIRLYVEEEFDSEWNVSGSDENSDSASKGVSSTEIQRETAAKVKRDKTVETTRVLAKTGRGSGTRCASIRGRDPAERGKGRGIASSSRNSKQGIKLRKGYSFKFTKQRDFNFRK